MLARSASGTRKPGARQTIARGLQAVIWRQHSPESGSLSAAGWRAQIQLVCIPKRVVIEHGGMEVADVVLSAGKNVRRGKENKRKIFRNQLLHSIVKALP